MERTNMKRTNTYPIFNYSRSSRALRSLISLLGGLGLWLQPIPEARAVAAMVVVTEDITARTLWQIESRLWNDLLVRIGQQVKLTENLAKWTGDPKSGAKTIVGNVSSVLDPTQCMLALAERKKSQTDGRETYSLARTGSRTTRPDCRVEPSFSQFGKTIKRDEKRYVAYAEQAALLARHDEAIRLLREVEQKELALQRSLLDRLRASQTHAEMAVIQAALTASQQRCSLAANKAEQARDEAGRHEAQTRLELQRKTEADREWTEALVERLRQRALTSLHAQRGQNS